MNNSLLAIKSYLRKPKLLITHSGSFHADDVMACAILQIYFSSIGYRTKIIRTRDQNIFPTGDVVFDVGGIRNDEENRFDHHQPGGAGARANGVPYSSVGLVWRKFGPLLCQGCEQLIEKIDQEIIQYIDARDNGYDLTDEQKPDGTESFYASFYMIERSTWKESLDEDDTAILKRFKRAVKKAQCFFKRYFEINRVNIEAAEKIKKIYQNSSDKKVLIFDQNFTRTVFVANLVNFTEPLIYIYPDRAGTYSVEVVPKNFGTFEHRISFPAAWAGLHDTELEKVSGIPELIFCHNKGFLCKTKNLESAKKVAAIALENQ